MNNNLRHLKTIFVFLFSVLIIQKAQAQTKPVITDDYSKKCYNTPFSLNVGKNTSTNNYDWEYGLSVPDTIANSAFFDAFLSELDGKISSAYFDNYLGDDVNINSISNAIHSTNYKYLAYSYFLDLYNSYSYNKNDIAAAVEWEIIKQNENLSTSEKAFLDTYFVPVFTSNEITPVPYFFSTKVDWKTLAYNVPSESIMFVPANMLEELTDKIRVNFRARGRNGDITGPFSDGSFRDILPAPPKGFVNATKSCPNDPTSIITISGITSPVSTKSFTYRIAESGASTYVSPDQIDNLTTSWGAFPKSFEGNTVIVEKKYGPKSYVVYLTYSDPNIANCLVGEPISVSSLESLNFNISSENASCPENADGKIHLIDIKGAPPFIYYQNDVEIQGPDINGLKKGEYFVSMTDGCIKDKSILKKKVPVSAPGPVDAILSFQRDPNCFSPANGGFDINVTGGTNGKFDYYIYSNINGVPSVNSLASLIGGNGSWNNYSLPGGKYIISVKDNANNLCFGDTIQHTLRPATPLKGNISAISGVKCFGEKTGSISIAATGGSGIYKYSLEDSSHLVPSGNIFNNLHAGIYRVIVKNSDPTCLDTVNRKAEVTSNTQIQITLFPKDVRCFEESNGQISAIVTGGTGNFTNDWEYKENGSWLPLFYKNPLTGLDPGTYRLKVRDNVGCLPVYKETIINQPQILSFKEIIPHDIRCIGELGSIAAEASGGNGTYSYWYSKNYSDYVSYIPGANLLTAGDYTLQVIDINGCKGTWNDIITLTSPDTALDFNTALSDFNGYNVRCKDEASGQINVSAFGGNGPGYNGYYYSLSGSPPQQENILINAPEGSQIIKVTDARGCTVEKTVQLTNPEALTLNTIYTKQVKCFGESTGEITVAAGGGIENTYSYKLNGEEMLSEVFQNLYADIYSIEVKDKNGCINTISTEVQNLYPAIQSVLIPQDIRCFGENNGKLEAYVSGGAGDLDLIWQEKSGDEWQDFLGIGLTQVDLGPGIYRLKATDTENCFAYNSAEIIEPGKLSINDITVKDVVCFGENGSLDVHLTGGVGGNLFDFTEKGGAVYESNLSKTDLPPGTYQTSIRDKNGCEASYPDFLTITAPESPIDFINEISSYNGFSVSCNGSANGFITVNPSGGNGSAYSGYTYSLSGSIEQPENNFKKLIAGSYDLKVTDQRGCSLLKTVVLNEPEPLNLNLRYTIPVKCFGNSTGEIAVEPAGGITNTYKYKLDGREAGSSGIFRNLAANNYLIEVTDLNGCIKDLPASVVHKNPDVQTNLVPVDVRCYGENNGMISSNVTGGAGGYIFTWEKKNDKLWQKYEGDQDVLNNLYKGQYRIRVTDLDNCAYFDTIEIREPELLAISGVKIKDAICYTDSGSLEISASGGNNGYSFFTSKNSVYVPYIQKQLIVPGTYKLKVEDSKGCETEKQENVTITKPDMALALNYSLKDYNGFNVSCHGNMDGILKFIPSGGNCYGYEGYTFQLTGRAPQNEDFLQGLEAGSYEITMTDGRGCKVKKPVILTEPPSEIFLQASVLKKPLCIYDTDGKIALTASGGTAPYTYSIDSNGFVSSAQFTNLPVRQYKFKVRDVNGCVESIDTTLISTVKAMDIGGIVADVRCYGENTGKINVLIEGGARPFRYRWNNTALSATNDNLAKGIYTVYVTDSADCKGEKTFTVKEPAAPLGLTVTSSPACVALQNGSLISKAIGGTPPYRFAVDNNDFLSSEKLNVYAGIHTVFAADFNDCKAEIKADVGERNKMPDVNFMLATSRFELDTLVVIDVSVPAPDKVSWQFSPEAKVIDSSSYKAKVRFDHTGVYPVKMTGYFGTCIYTIEKLLNIAPFDPLVTGSDKNHRGIKSMAISPNPNIGSFDLKVELYSKEKINVKVYDYYSRLVLDQKFPAETQFNEKITLPDGLMPGTYMLWIIAEDDARSSVFIISH